MSTSQTPSLIYALSEADYAPLAGPKALDVSPGTLLTSNWETEPMSRRKADGQAATEPSLKSSSASTPEQLSESYYKETTSLVNPAAQHTQFGQLLTQSAQQLADMFPQSGQTLAQQQEAAVFPNGRPKAETHDDGKAPLANLPWAAVEAMSRVQLYGHKKYKDFNNYRKGMEVTRNLSCALRHIKEYLEGYEVDQESKESPLAHAMCRVAFVLQNIHDGKAIDDRYKP